MRTRTRWVAMLGMTLACGSVANSAWAQSGRVAPLNAFVQEGRLAEGLAVFSEPRDNTERFSLGLLQALEGLQRFSAGLNRIGIRNDAVRTGIPFLRVAGTRPPAGGSGPAAAATPEAVAGLFRDLYAALERANRTLSAIDEAAFKVEVNLSEARMDLDGDGQVADDEFMLEPFGRSLGFRRNNRSADGNLIVRFDNADAAWLTGYTHVIMGLLDLFRSYDWMPVWTVYARMLFENPQPPPPLQAYLAPREKGRSSMEFLDHIAALHALRLEPVAPAGWRRARDHFMAVAAASRLCWQRAQAETDDDLEWLPNPSQTGPRGAKTTAEQIAAWHTVLDEVEAVLTGKALLPHARLKPGAGINVSRLVADPPVFDLVMWVQGSGLLPYLETGKVSDLARWQALIRPFGPGFALFALWSN